MARQFSRQETLRVVGHAQTGRRSADTFRELVVGLAQATACDFMPVARLRNTVSWLTAVLNLVKKKVTLSGLARK